jgi:hypothetical protein
MAKPNTANEIERWRKRIDILLLCEGSPAVTPEAEKDYSKRGANRPGLREYNSAVDPLAARAAEDYHHLLRDDKALVEELEARFFERMRQARLTFGGRVLCAFPRPNFVAP